MYRIVVSVLLLLATTPALARDGLTNFGKNTLHPLPTADSGNSLGADLSDDQIASGIKDILKTGTEKSLATLARAGGFVSDKKAHILLPPELEKERAGLTKLGVADIADNLELRINQSAEIILYKGRSTFEDAARRITVEGARSILNGPPGAAALYFRGKATAKLSEALKKIVDGSLDGTGAAASYKAYLANVKLLPNAPSVNIDLHDYVLNKTLDGFFYYIAMQEVELRTNPAARTTPWLRTLYN